MELIPTRYKGMEFSSIPLKVILSSGFNTEISVVFNSRADETPEYGGKIIGGSHIFLTATFPEESDIFEMMEVVSALFNPFDKDMGQLVFEDISEDPSREWFVDATTAKPPTYEGNQATIEMAVADPFFKTVDKSTGVWDVLSSGSVETFANIGNQYAYPKIKITPLSAKTGGYARRKFICIWNNTSNIVADYNLDVTGQTGKQLDTAALVSLGRLQSSCADMRLLVDGREIMFWLTGANTSATGVNTAEIKLSPKIEMTLSGAITSGATVTSLTCKATKTNQTALKSLATVANKTLVIKTGSQVEVFTFTSVDPAKYRIDGVAREQKLSTAIAHGDGDLIRWVEHDIWLVYGNPAAPAMQVSDSRKPMIDLLNSTNLLWYWSEFLDETYPLRPATWVWKKTATSNKVDTVNVSDNYTGAGVTEANPASVMGLISRSFLSGTTWKAENATMKWAFYDPCGCTTVTMNDGRKYKHKKSFPTYRLQKSKDGTKFTAVATEPDPTAEATWQNFTVLSGAKALSGTYNHIEFYMSGSVAGAVANNCAAAEVSTVSMQKETTLVPSIYVFNEEVNHHIEEEIANLTNGDVITLVAPCGVGESITIDVENMRVTHSDGTEMLACLERKNAWLRFSPGENTLKVTDAGLVNVRHEIEWTNRSLQ